MVPRREKRAVCRRLGTACFAMFTCGAEISVDHGSWSDRVAGYPLPPLLYIEPRVFSDYTACDPYSFRTVSRQGHLWKWYPTILLLSRRETQPFADAADRFGRVRCAWPGQALEKARAELGESFDESIGSLCTYHNASLSGLRVSPDVHKECGGLPLGVIIAPDAQALSPSEITRLRKDMLEEFPGAPTSYHSMAAHDVVEEHALQWRFGTEYSQDNKCSHTCCVECGYCAYPDVLDLLWLLKEFLAKRPSLSASAHGCVHARVGRGATTNFLNFGCGSLEAHDPLSSFIFGRDARPVMGLCVDLNETRLAEAREKLSAAGVDGVDLQHLALSPDPHALDKLLATAESRCLLPIDIFKVDVDSFDIELAVRTLSSLEQRVGYKHLPVAVIVEFNPILPPPVEVLTRFVRPMTEGPTNYRRGCLNSLSGAVAQLSQLGYRLHRLVYNDLVFVHERAAQDATGETFVAQDEWACYLESLLLLRPQDARAVKHWLLSNDPVSLQEDVIRYCTAHQIREHAAHAAKAVAEAGAMKSELILSTEVSISALKSGL